jgi:cation:H+ antiporter
MALINLALFLASLFLLVKSADYATRYSSRLARSLHLSEFIISFFIVAVISVSPEAAVSVISAIEGVPEFGLGTLLGSNVADLTLVLGIVVLVSFKGVSVKSEILREDYYYLALLLAPIILGLDGFYSRIDGLMLVLSGLLFFYTLSLESKMFRRHIKIKNRSALKNLILLVLSLGLLLVSAVCTVNFGIGFAEDVQLPPILVGLTIVSIGTCLPELLFSIRAVRTKHDELALGDILSTVIIDATIILGITALISPFHFKAAIIYITGLAMFLAGLLTVVFITTGKILTKKEGIYLLFFYIAYLIVEFVSNNLI